MKLAEIFQSGMVLQREKPIHIWGISEQWETIEIRINGKMIAEEIIEQGFFAFDLPPQQAMENALLTIGDCKLEQVDIGEVWVAGGQSNMEFLFKHTEEFQNDYKIDDEHIRMYTVGQYSFDGEREEGYKANHAWDEWYSATKENCKEMSAVALFFAEKLQQLESRVPVGIISCSWGGTSASSWLEQKFLKEDASLQIYIEEYENALNETDLESGMEKSKETRALSETAAFQKFLGYILENTYLPDELPNRVREWAVKHNAGYEISKVLSDGNILVPDSPHIPGRLFDSMIRKVAGFSNRGILWYQGESDETHADIYDKLLSALIDCWRTAWKEELPFLIVQLAPFGTWAGNTGDNYPTVREKQEKVCGMKKDVYMASSSDVGNVYDIHPKLKKPVGERLAMLAEKYIYGKNVLADAPKGSAGVGYTDHIEITFKNAEGLYMIRKDEQKYNSSTAEQIDQKYLPPVLDRVNGLRIDVDDRMLTDAVCEIENDRLVIKSKKFKDAKKIVIRFAETAFYEVNLYNKSGIPAIPFHLIIGER